jgi:hypothetical protein
MESKDWMELVVMEERVEPSFHSLFPRLFALSV